MDCSSPKRPPPPRWIKAWVPQSLVASGGKCSLLKWIREDTLKDLEGKDLEPEDTKPELTTEVLFLCSYGGCGRTFINAADIRKHAATHGERKHAHTHGERKHAAVHGERKHAHTHGESKHAAVHGYRKHAAVHGERQYVCQYEGCGKRFMDSSKLKRHFLTHTGEKPFKCSFEGCGKPFALDFNLKVHMKTHCPENYHVCSYPECGKRFTHESKLNSHIKAHQQKNMAAKNTPAATKHNNAPKIWATNYRSASVARPYACPYEGCSKAYIHGYKLNLHLRSTHAVEDPSKCTLATTDHAIAQAIDQGVHRANLERINPVTTHIDQAVHRANLERINPVTTHMMPPPKLPNRMGSSFNAVNKQWPANEMYEDDSEGCYENAEVGLWRYQGENEDEDEGTEDED